MKKVPIRSNSEQAALSLLVQDPDILAKQHWDDEMEGKAKKETLPTSLLKLDRCLQGGMHRGEMMTVAAETGGGKSILLENEIRFTRVIACELIRQAVHDVKKTRKLKRAYAKNVSNLAHSSAIYFLRSKAFDEICEALGLPTSKIRLQAFR